MKHLCLLVLLLSSLTTFAADVEKEILLWPEGAPGSEGKTAPENVGFLDKCFALTDGLNSNWEGI